MALGLTVPTSLLLRANEVTGQCCLLRRMSPCGTKGTWREGPIMSVLEGRTAWLGSSYTSRFSTRSRHNSGFHPGNWLFFDRVEPGRNCPWLSRNPNIRTRTCRPSKMRSAVSANPLRKRRRHAAALEGCECKEGMFALAATRRQLFAGTGLVAAVGMTAMLPRRADAKAPAGRGRISGAGGFHQGTGACDGRRWRLRIALTI